MKNIYFVLGLLLFQYVSFGQVEVTLPVERMVLQRDKNNRADIHIGGNVSSTFDKIEARLVTLDKVGKPVLPAIESTWTAIITNQNSGTFLGKLENQPAGWYHLEVRAIRGDSLIGKVSTVKMGIGEVFLIAGQSNAQGDPPIEDPTLYDAEDDRVSCINEKDLGIDKPFKYPKFSKITKNVFVGPTGNSSWCWPILGDEITKNWDVPVAFLNCAIGNTGVFVWRASAKREFEPTSIDSRSGFPYIHLQRTLNYYCSFTGVRAVLWHQGEVDTGIFEFGNGLDPSIYTNNLKQVIEISRRDYGKNVSWVIAKASMVQGNTSWRVIRGQEMVSEIANFNAFAGPYTDVIQPRREDRDGGQHFKGQGIIDLGKGWFNSINNSNFLNNSKPHKATEPLKTQILGCGINNNTTLQMPDGLFGYEWYDTQKNRLSGNLSYSTNTKATFYPYMRESANGNYIVSPAVSYSPAVLNLTLDGPANNCEGTTVNVLPGNFNATSTWQDGKSLSKFPITKAGTYNINVGTTDVYGCSTSAAATFTVQFNPIPKKATITSDVPTVLCEGNRVILSSNDDATLKRVWSTGSIANSILVNTPQSISLKLLDGNNCASPVSEIVNVVVNPNPNKPEIQAGGPTLFCTDDKVTLATALGNSIFSEKSYEWLYNGVLDKNLNGKFISASLPGNYQARIYNQFNCPSPLTNTIKIENYALPAAPVITANGDTRFCAGGAVELKADSRYINNLVWISNSNANYSNNETIKFETQKDVKVNISDKFTAYIRDERGCQSRLSNSIAVDVRANPTKPFIGRKGTFALEANTIFLGIDGQKYDWFLGNASQTNIGDGKKVKIDQNGAYTVQSKIIYPIADANSLECKSELSSVFNYYEDYTNIFAIYPNPVKQNEPLKLDIRQPLDDANLLIYNLKGQLLFSERILNFNEEKQLALKNFSLPEGNYKVVLKTGEKQFYRNLIITR